VDEVNDGINLNTIVIPNPKSPPKKKMIPEEREDFIRMPIRKNSLFLRKEQHKPCNKIFPETESTTKNTRGKVFQTLIESELEESSSDEF